MAQADHEPPPVEVLAGDLRVALELVGLVESLSLGIVRVLVVDDDERLGELTARGLRRMGYDAESAGRLRALRPREVVVFDLSVIRSLSTAERDILRSSRPIVVTGGADPASRALAEDLDAADYLVKPVDMDALSAAIKRTTAAPRP